MSFPFNKNHQVEWVLQEALQFSIFNLQFSILNSREALRKASVSKPNCFQDLFCKVKQSHSRENHRRSSNSPFASVYFGD